MPTMQDIYNSARQLPPKERLRLAALLLDDLVEEPTSSLLSHDIRDYKEKWTEEDRIELLRTSHKHLDELYPEDADYPLPQEQL